MAHYDPLATLRGFQGVSEIQGAGVERRARLLQLAQAQKQWDDQQKIDAAAKASVTNVPARSMTTNPGSINVGGVDLSGPTSEVSTPAGTQFDSSGFSGRLRAIDPLMAQNYDRQQVAIQQQQGDAQVERATKLATLEKTLGDIVTQKGAAAKTDLENVKAAAELQGQWAMSVKNAPAEIKPQVYQSVLTAVSQHPQFAQFAQQLPPQYTPEIEPFLDSIITGAQDVSKATEAAQKKAESSSKTVQTAEGVLQFNPDTNAYDKRIGSPTKALNINNNGGMGAGQDVSLIDKQKQPHLFKIAQDLAYGNLTIQQMKSLYGYSRNSAAQRQALYATAQDINPNFSPAQFEMGFSFAKNPKVKQQLASLDNVVSGVKDLLRMSDEASRTGVKTLNDIIIKGGAQFNGKKYSNFQTAQTAFADELSGALGYGSATDMSREMGFNMTDKNLSPEAFSSAIQDVVVPFVQRKKASLLGQMGPYGAPGSVNPGATPYPTQQPAAGGFNWNAHPVTK